MSNLDIKFFVRKPFDVKAVQVTTENMAAIADWAGGEIRENAEGKKFIKIETYRPITSRQTRAYIGDWVLYAGEKINSFKIYTDVAFENSFDSKN